MTFTFSSIFKLIRPPVWAGLLLVFMFILMNMNSWHKNLSFDEPHNLRYGYDVLTKGPLAETDGQRMPVFALHALSCKSYGCVYEETVDQPWRLFWIRLPSMLFTMALGWLVWFWTRKLYGPAAALGALFLFALNPNFIAHGKQVTSDNITAFFVLLTVYLFWEWRITRKEKFFYGTAAAAGIAMVVKFSSILLLGILPLILIIQNILTRESIWNLKTILFFFGRTLIFGGLIWIIINSAYLFQGSFESTRSYEWQSRFYQNIAKKIDAPIPLPRIFVRGLDYSHFIEEKDQYGRGNNYILGHRHRKGRDYSFLVMILLKTPVGFFLMLGAALTAWKQGATQGLPAPREIPSLYLWIPFAAWLVFFSSLCDIQVGIRYILPGYIFLLIFASKAFAAAGSKIKYALLFASCGWYALSSLSYHPHTMSYFNELIGSRMNAYKYLADSNLDWEDKTYYIKKWEKDHPGISYLTHPEAMRNPQAGFYLMPTNFYVGVFDEDKYAWIREFKPLTHITYSHYLIYASEEKLNEALEKHPVPSLKR